MRSCRGRLIPPFDEGFQVGRLVVDAADASTHSDEVDDESERLAFELGVRQALVF